MAAQFGDCRHAYLQVCNETDPGTSVEFGTCPGMRPNISMQSENGHVVTIQQTCPCASIVRREIV